MNSQLQYNIFTEESSEYQEIINKFVDANLLHNTNRKGFISFLIGKEKIQRTYKISEMNKVLSELDLNQDIWIMTNESWGFSRKKKYISRITCLYTDLDTYHSDYAHMTPEEVIPHILAECEANYFPIPTTAMFSGRGIQLKWIFTEPEKANFTSSKRFDEAQRAVQVMFDKFGADKKALDLSRVLRLECSLNSKSQLFTRRLELPSLNFYTLNNLHTFLDEFIPLPVEKKEKAVRQVKQPKLRIAKEKKAKTENEKPNKEEFAKNEIHLAIDNTRNSTSPHTLQKKGLFSLNTQRYLDLKRLVAMRGNVSGSRMHFLVWIMNFKALAGQVTLDNFMEQTKIEADILFKDGDYNLNDMISVMTKLQTHLKGERIVHNGKICSPLYTPKNETLIDIFDITAEEQAKLKTIIGDSERAERHRLSEMNRRRVNGAISREEYLANSLSNTQPWLAMNISRRTYFRRKEAGLLPN